MSRNRIYLCLAHMSDEGLEQKYIKEAFDTNWVVPLGPNVNGFEKDLEDFVNENGNQNEKLSKREVALRAGTAAVHLSLLACGVICAGIGRGQMTVVNDHIAHHKHVQALYEELLKDVKGIKVHGNPDSRYDSNYWLCTITLDENLKIKGQENAYKTIVTGAVGGAAGVIHAAASAHTDCEPNANVEALRVALDMANIEARPVWKPMHKQPCYCRMKDGSREPRVESMENGVICQTSDASVSYINGVSEAVFKTGMCLPAGPYVTDDDVRYIVETIKSSIL